MSYGTNLAEVWRQLGDYAGLQTARAFDLESSIDLSATDEVIE
jgi:hypothetical protein